MTNTEREPLKVSTVDKGSGLIMSLVEHSPKSKGCPCPPKALLWFLSILIVLGFQSVHILKLEAQVAKLSRSRDASRQHSPQPGDENNLSTEDNDEAGWDSTSRTSDESFTWNTESGCQTWPRQHHPSPKGIVTTLILTPEDAPSVKFVHVLVCRTLPSQLTHLLGPQQWDMLLLIAGKTFQDRMSFDYLSQCLNLEIVPKQPTKVWKNLDGTTLTTTEYRWNDRVSVFLAHTDLAWPQYIQKDMSILKKKIEPPHCNMAKSYIQGTRWYSTELLHLAILQNYQWFAKLDLDLFFVKTVEWNLLHDLQTRNSVFAHTAEYPSDQGKDCADNIVQAMQDFVKGNSNSLKYCDTENPSLKKDKDYYFSNFVIGRVDFWTQPIVRQLGRFLSEYPEGFFHYRWTDQIFWHQALGLLVPLNKQSVTDLTDLRCSPERNCWLAVWHGRLYNDQDIFKSLSTRCDNDAYFAHTKNEKMKWSRQVTHTGQLWQSDTELYPLSYKDECSEILPRKYTELSLRQEKEKQTRPEPACQSWRRRNYLNPKGIVTTLVLTPDDEKEKTFLRKLMCRSIPSQLTHLIGPQQWDMLLLIGGNQNHEKIPFDVISDCLSLTVADKADAVKVWHNLDGTTVTTTEYRWRNQVSIFLGHVQLEWPQYIQKDMSILKRKIEPDMCNMPKSQIQGPRWYTNELLHLAILQDYKWFIKLDVHVFFVRTVEWSLLHDLQTRNSLFAHTAAYPKEMGASCATNIVNAIKAFVESSSDSSHCDADNPSLKIDRDHYYTNFIIGRVDFWTQPLVRELGRYLSEYKAGFFMFRWTDEIFWAQALGLFVHVNEQTVTDYTELRCSVERNCWQAVFYSYLYGEGTHDVCDNDAYFMYTKNADSFRDREVSHTGDLWENDIEVHPLSYKDECSEKLSHKQNEVNAKKAANQ